ncbi:MAG: ATP-dependent DNA ligase, partial [Candidatus Peribacteraceae bacterium]|nr:ATP-dependent DNA ligase [Candidatus Peribacteraceae bacterium]
MKYSKLVDLYEYLENTPARLAKVEKIGEFFREAEPEILEKVALLVQGKIFPSYSDNEIGIAEKMMIRVIVSSTGFSENEVVDTFKETGDLGLTVEKLMENKKQTTLAIMQLSIEKVFENLRKLASIEGKGTQDTKISLIKELISHAKPKEAKYIVRTAVSQLRIGVAEGVMRDSIAGAFFSWDDMAGKKEVISIVEWAWFLRPDYSEIIKIAKDSGLDGLKNVSVEVGKPYHVLLADRAGDMVEAMEKFERPEIEYKYDGARICIHKRDDKYWFFTRRLEDITKQFPDLLEIVKRGIKSNDCIIEGEMIAIDTKTGRPSPFQMLSQRIKRKYDIGKVAKEIPVQVNVFDVVYNEGKQLFSETLENRRKVLAGIVNEIPDKFQLAESIETNDIDKANKFYQSALKSNHEGVIIKNLDATYQPGRRV